MNRRFLVVYLLAFAGLSVPACAVSYTATGISNTGYVVGMCGPEAFRWDGTAAPQRLDGPGLKDAPYAVNNQGIVAGWAGEGAGHGRAGIWLTSGGEWGSPRVS